MDKQATPEKRKAPLSKREISAIATRNARKSPWAAWNPGAFKRQEPAKAISNAFLLGEK